MKVQCPQCGMVITDDTQKRCPRCNAVLIKRSKCEECKGCKIKNCLSAE